MSSQPSTPQSTAYTRAPAAPGSDPVETASPERAEVKPFLCRKPVRITIYAFLGLFLTVLLASQFVPPLLDPTFEKHIQSHRVMVGMSREQVLQAWGSPNTINVSFTQDGVRREEWIFEDWESAAVVKHRYLYFEEGKLVGGWYKGSDQRIPTKPPAGPPQFPQRPL
jgi:hypothetical protein